MCIRDRCNTTKDYGVDLRRTLDSIQAPDYSQPIIQGDIEIYFKPMTYKNLSDNNKMQFDDQRTLNSLNISSADDVTKISAIADAIKKMTEMTVIALAQSIVTIKTPTAIVNEPEYITEFMINCDRTMFNRIQNYVIEKKTMAEMQPLEITCDQCQHTYKQPLTLDMSNFFERAS